MFSKKHIQWFLLIVFLLLQNSNLYSQYRDRIAGGFSEPYLYISDNGNPLAIREKSDLKLSVDYFASQPNRGINLKLGYSPLPHIYGTASLLAFRKGQYSNWFGYDPKITIADIGIGVYYLTEIDDLIKNKPLSNKKRKWLMEKKGVLANALLGYGRGEIQHTKNSRGGFGDFELNKFYGQVGLDCQGKLWGLAAAARVGILNYKGVILNGNAIVDFARPVERLKEKNNFTFSEITFRVYAGIGVGQIYVSGILGRIDDIMTEFSLMNYVSVGVVLDIERIFRKKKKE